MPFDPTKPAPGDDLDAVLVLAQLNALKAMIDAQAAAINAQSSQILTIVNNPPQQYEVQPIADKLDELINALRRWVERVLRARFRARPRNAHPETRDGARIPTSLGIFAFPPSTLPSAPVAG